MSGFAYFDGEKWIENLTMKDIRALAMSGVITESTLIRNPDGQEKEARFCGLFFSDTPPQTDEEIQTEDKSIMAPAIGIIETLVGMAVVCAAISGIAALLGVGFATDFQTRPFGVTLLVGGISATTSFLFTAMLLAILKYFVKCFDSMEQTFRRIEKNTRKDNQIQ